MAKNKGKQGPLSKYHDEYPRIAKVACEEGGFTDIGLAKLFNVCKATITIWKREHPEFGDAIRQGKESFDTNYVEKALLKRALGYSYEEVIHEAGREGKLVPTRKIQKHLAGDVKAQIFWLRNRNRKRWPDTDRHEGAMNINLTHEEMLNMLDGHSESNWE